jgi:hypothetical protein
MHAVSHLDAPIRVTSSASAQAKANDGTRDGQQSIRGHKVAVNIIYFPWIITLAYACAA